MSAPLQPQSQNAQPVPMFLQKKGLLGGKGAKMGSIVSPTDNVLSPCSAKLSGAKQRHFQNQLAASGSSGSVSSTTDKRVDF